MTMSPVITEQSGKVPRDSSNVSVLALLSQCEQNEFVILVNFL